MKTLQCLPPAHSKFSHCALGGLGFVVSVNFLLFWRKEGALTHKRLFRVYFHFKIYIYTLDRKH